MDTFLFQKLHFFSFKNKIRSNAILFKKKKFLIWRGNVRNFKNKISLVVSKANINIAKSDILASFK